MNTLANKADKNKKRDRSEPTTQPDSVGVHHGGFWSRRPRFESESGYLSIVLRHKPEPCVNDWCKKAHDQSKPKGTCITEHAHIEFAIPIGPEASGASIM